MGPLLGITELGDNHWRAREQSTDRLAGFRLRNAYRVLVHHLRLLGAAGRHRRRALSIPKFLAQPEAR